jgi:hypothetical protein
MFKLRNKDKLTVKTKGVGNSLINILSPIPYEVRVLDGDWSGYFGKYQNQRWGLWDSDSCWCLSAVNSAEDQLEWLWKNGMFTLEAKTFFTANNYIDSDGDFSLSERFHEILCGNLDQGGTAEEAWQSFKSRGFIPRSMLTYSLEQSGKWGTKAAFNADYFNSAAVTPTMLVLAKQSLQHISIAYQRIGKPWQTPNHQILMAAMKQAPVNYGIPVPKNVQNWNSTNVKWDGKLAMEHEVEGYRLPDDGTYPIFDQYLPNLKILSPDYYIASAVQGIINVVQPATTNPVPQPKGETDDTFWTWVMGWFNGWFTDKVSVGSTE